MKEFAVSITMLIVFASSAFAERGWACAEGNVIQKYKLVGNTMVAEGDPFSNMVQSNNRKLGLSEYNNLQTWQLLVNNPDGLVAMLSSAGKRTEAGNGTTERNGIPYTYADLLMINKGTGAFRHVVSNVSTKQPSLTAKEGNCVDY